MTRRLALLAVVAVMGGCTHTGNVRQKIPSASSAPSSIDLPCMQTSHGCIALNPDVVQETIAQTICASGYTASIRPATHYTNGVKAKLLSEAGKKRADASAYELDHIIPLAVGGNPRKLSNLALQPWDGAQGAHKKDLLERRLQRKVCRGEMTLTEAQYCIGENWSVCETEVAAGRRLPGGRVVTNP